MGFNIGGIGGYVGLIAIAAIVILALTGHCTATIGPFGVR